MHEELRAERRVDERAQRRVGSVADVQLLQQRDVGREPLQDARAMSKIPRLEVARRQVPGDDANPSPRGDRSGVERKPRVGLDACVVDPRVARPRVDRWVVVVVVARSISTGAAGAERERHGQGAHNVNQASGRCH